MKSFVKKKKDPKQLIYEIIQQIFGYINRRENISQLVSQIKELKLLDEVSTRFFVSLIL